MASTSQIEANRRNAKRSTGPRTPEGKATVARNGVSHGLSANKFALLPWEDPAEFEQLLKGLEAEHQPSTPTEAFLVTEMARAQWKLNRVAHIEYELLAGKDGASDWAELASNWRHDCTYNHKLQKLERYETSLRRAWYRALNTLMKLRTPPCTSSKPAAPETKENYKAKPIEEAPANRRNSEAPPLSEAEVRPSPDAPRTEPDHALLDNDVHHLPSRASDL